MSARSLFAAVPIFAATVGFAAPVVPHSVGAPNAGRLEAAMRLKLGSTIRVVGAYAANDARFGTRDLVLLLEHAAKQVAQKHPKAVLGIGDLSKAGGGTLTHHASHQSGRDADLAFFLCVFRADLGTDSGVTWALVPEDLGTDSGTLGRAFRHTWAAVPAHLGAD